MKTCPNCQIEYEDEITFCGKCGTALVEKGPKESPTIEQVETTEVLSKGEPVAEPRKRKKKWPLIVGIISVLAIIGVVTFLSGGKSLGPDPAVGSYVSEFVIAGSHSITTSAFHLTIRNDNTFSLFGSVEGSSLSLAGTVSIDKEYYNMPDETKTRGIQFNFNDGGTVSGNIVNDKAVNIWIDYNTIHLNKVGTAG